MNETRIVVLGQAGFVPIIPMGPVFDTNILMVLRDKKIHSPNPALLHMLKQTVVEKDKNDYLAMVSVILTGLSEDKKIINTLGFSSLFAKIVSYLDIRPVHRELAFDMVRMTLEEWDEKKEKLTRSTMISMAGPIAQAARRFFDPEPVPQSRLIMNLRKFILPSPLKYTRMTPVFNVPPPYMHVLDEVVGVDEVVEKIDKLSPIKLEREKRYVESFYRKRAADIDFFDIVDVIIHRETKKSKEKPKEEKMLVSSPLDPEKIFEEGIKNPDWRNDKNLLEASLALFKQEGDARGNPPAPLMGLVLYVMEECFLAQGRNIKSVWRN